LKARKKSEQEATILRCVSFPKSATKRERKRREMEIREL